MYYALMYYGNMLETQMGTTVLEDHNDSSFTRLTFLMDTYKDYSESKYRFAVKKIE
jgi:hypothetical protein